jgi:hypothetical protein
MYDNNDENYYSSDLSDNEENYELVACEPSQKNKIVLVLTSKFGVFSLAPH